MANPIAITAGTLKFAGALAVGLLLLTILQLVLLFTVPHFRVPVLPLGLLLVLVLSVRFAIGKRTRVDRAAGVAAAGATAAVASSIALIAAAVFLFGLLGSVLIAGFGAGPRIVYLFAPIGMKALVVYSLGMLGAFGLIYAASRIWKS